MKTTKHFSQRMSQRGINKRLVDLALEHGEISGKKVIFDKQMIQNKLKEIDRIRRDLMKAMDKGGITVVLDGDTLVTTYAA